MLSMLLRMAADSTAPFVAGAIVGTVVTSLIFSWHLATARAGRGPGGRGR